MNHAVRDKTVPSSGRRLRSFVAFAALLWLVVLCATQCVLHRTLLSDDADPLAPLNRLGESAPVQRRLEFVHITKTGGTAIESAGFQGGILWGACHYISVPAVGCSRPDLNYTAPHFQSYKLTSPWHMPPKTLRRYAISDTAHRKLYPYHGADLFTVVRNPYDRVVSEYYCPWQGFHIKHGKQRQWNLRKEINDPGNLNWWVQDTIRRLHQSIQTFEAQRHPHHSEVQPQGAGTNEDPEILAQKHYINQAEYVFRSDGSILIQNVLHYENLSAEFDALVQKYHLEGVHLPQKENAAMYNENGIRNEKPRLTYKDLDAQSIQLINQYARQDFEKLGYVMVENGVLGDNYSLEARVK